MSIKTSKDIIQNICWCHQLQSISTIHCKMRTEHQCAKIYYIKNFSVLYQKYISMYIHNIIFRPFIDAALLQHLVDCVHKINLYRIHQWFHTYINIYILYTHPFQIFSQPGKIPILMLVLTNNSNFIYMYSTLYKMSEHSTKLLLAFSGQCFHNVNLYYNFNCLVGRS